MVALRKTPGQEAACAFLASQLWEEAKHAEFFARWIDEVAGGPDLAPYASEAHAALFERRLPARWTAPHRRLGRSARPAVTTYHVFIEGVLAETGYHGFYTCFKSRVLPGLVAGIEHVQRDEARHIAFGIDLLRERFERSRRSARSWTRRPRRCSPSSWAPSQTTSRPTAAPRTPSASRRRDAHLCVVAARQAAGGAGSGRGRGGVALSPCVGSRGAVDLVGLRRTVSTTRGGAGVGGGSFSTAS